MITKIYTIGVYNSTEDSFFDKLKSNDIELFCDIRLRRGVRGAQYKYVNKTYLESKLTSLGIQYLHIKELAPTKEIRQKQKDADKLNKETKKQRGALGKDFIVAYCNRILNPFDMHELIARIESMGVERIAFFCVEEQAQACHRSLVAKQMGSLLNVEVEDL